VLDFLVRLHEHLLLGPRLQSLQIYVVLVLAHFTLPLVVLRVELHEVHPHGVEIRHLLLVHVLLLLHALLQLVDVGLYLVHLSLSLLHLVAHRVANVRQTFRLLIQLIQVVHLVDLLLLDLHVLGADLIQFPYELLHQFDALAQLLTARVVILVFL
jgi:hypothetical protein